MQVRNKATNRGNEQITKTIKFFRKRFNGKWWHRKQIVVQIFWFFNKDIVFCKTFFQKLCDICGKRNHEKYAQNIKKCMKKCEFGSIRRIHLEKFDENIQKLYEQWQKRERNNSGSHIEQNMC